MDPLSFNRLLKRIKTDADALDRLYNYYYPRIILHIKKAYPGASAEDVAQEFFFMLLKSETQGYIIKPTSWVFAVCENLVKSRYKKEAVSFPASDLLESVEDPSDMSERVLENIRSHEIFKLIKDEATKEIIYLYYWEGYSQKEIAERLGMTAANVRKKHSRAIKFLKKTQIEVSHNDHKKHS